MKLNNKNWTLGVLAILSLSLLFFLAEFGSEPISAVNDTSWPTRDELRRKVREIRKELLVYGTGNRATAAAYRTFAENYARQMDRLQIIVKPDTAVTPEELAALPLWLIGMPSSNFLLTKVRDGLPLQLAEKQFSFGDAVYSDSLDVFVLSLYPNPLNLSLPVSIISGNSDLAVAEFLMKTYSRSARSGDVQVFRDGQGIAFGFFKQTNNGPWKIDTDKTRNYLNTARLVLQTAHYDFIYHGTSSLTQRIRIFAEIQEERIRELMQRVPGNFSIPRIQYHLYESFEDKGLITRDTDLSHANFDKGQVHAIFNDDINGDFYSDARLIIQRLVGKCDSPALRDGVGMYFSENWGQRGFRYWAKLIYQTGNANPLADLLDSKIYARESYLFMRPLAGSFVEFLISKYGWNNFLELYKSWPELGLPKTRLPGFTIPELEKGWLAYLENLKVDLPDRKTDGSAFQPVFQKGFCYAHEGYQIYNGYLSRKSFESLQKLRALGSDWISLTPFGYLDDRNKPSYLHYSFGAGAESDESLIAAAGFAKKLGMRVMLKPHVLMNSWNWGWPGEIEMKTGEDWRLFFKYYNSWIRHYALLAEMYEMDIFCIGVELTHTTRDRQSEWREMISRIRQIYRGPLVYAANWFQEFEQITFWDELDYIGLNLYYPLSQKDTVTVADLINGMNTGMPVVERIVRKYNKPLLLTEVGFTSSAQPWKTPHERNRGAPVAFEDQAMCYQAIFKSFWDKDWFFGFYWWKWPTYLEYGGPNNNDFTPNGKPAEKVVAEWYAKNKMPAQKF